MAFAHVAPWLSPWMSLGLRHLLEPEDLPPEFSPCLLPEEAEEARRAALARRRMSGPPHAPDGAAGEGAPSGRGAPAGTDRRAPVPRRPAPEPAPRPAPPASPAPGAERDSWSPLPAERWPEAWRKRLQATKPGLIAWCYAAMGRDLARMPDPPDAACSCAERGDLLRRFLRELRHPAGTHTFWPVCLPGAEPDAPDVPNPDVFWSGLRLLKVRGLVLMGSPALRAAALKLRVQPQELPTSIRHRGLKIWIVWSPENLVVAESRCRAILAYLRNEFRFFLPQ